jgi:hypothetical protein
MKERRKGEVTEPGGGGGGTSSSDKNSKTQTTTCWVYTSLPPKPHIAVVTSDSNFQCSIPYRHLDGSQRKLTQDGQNVLFSRTV